jgi:hypothetical protein
MYLEAATLTELEERRVHNLKRADRVRAQLHGLIAQSALFGPLIRQCISHELDYLDARRAELCADALAQALSLMYPTRVPQQTVPPY